MFYNKKNTAHKNLLISPVPTKSEDNLSCMTLTDGRALHLKLLAEDQMFLRFMKTHKRSLLPTMDSLTEAMVHTIIGRHVLAEFDAKKLLLSCKKLRDVLFHAAEYAGATILSINFFDTPNGGVSGAVVIAESHLIAHLFPDGYLAVDIYTCGQTIDPMKALQFIERGLGIAAYDVTCVKRGVKPKDYAGADSSSRFAFGVAKQTDSQMLSFFRDRKLSPSAHSAHASHYVVEMYFSSPASLRNDSRLATCFSNAFDYSFHTKITHAFPPVGIGGVSLVYLGPGIHVTTHPWPELSGYTPLDIFVSSDCEIDPSEAVRRLAEQLSSEFGPADYVFCDFPRGVKHQSKLVPALDRGTRHYVSAETLAHVRVSPSPFTHS